MSKIWIKSDKIETKFKKYLSKFNSDFFFNKSLKNCPSISSYFGPRLESFGPDQKKPSLQNPKPLFLSKINLDASKIVLRKAFVLLNLVWIKSGQKDMDSTAVSGVKSNP